MFKNFFKIALRNFLRQKTYVFINITGLTISLVFSIIIFLFIRDELSYDKYNERYDRIYRVYLKGKMGDAELSGAWTPAPAARVIKEELAEVEDAVTMDAWGEVVVKVDGESYVEKDFMLADQSFFNIFSIELIQGDPETALETAHSVVLTEKKAKQYFGSQNPIGKNLIINNDTSQFIVTGVCESPPRTSHFTFDLLGSFKTHPRATSDYWLSNSFYTYLLLNDPETAPAVEDKLSSIVLKYVGPQVENALGISLDEFENAGNRYGLFIQHIGDIHLSPEIKHGLNPSNDRKYITIFSLAALFILVMAAINYMNLSTARSKNRAREVGLRKVVGSSKTLLVSQFLWESLAMVFISLFLAIMLVELLLPYFNNFIHLDLTFDYLSSWYLLPSLLLIAVVIGVLSGSYPAFFLSSFKPVAVLYSKIKTGRGNKMFRDVSVVVQFFISILIILGTIIIYQQIRYMLNKDLGFDKEQLLVLRRMEAVGTNKVAAFKQEIEKISGVISSTNSTAVPGNPNNNNGFILEGTKRDQTYMMQVTWCDYDFLETYDLELMEGRFLSEKYITDSSAMVINESAVNKFRLEEPLQTRFLQPKFENADHHKPFHVVGVVKNFHFESLHQDISPCVFIQKPGSWDWGGYLTVRVHKEGVQNTVQQIHSVWENFTTNDPMQYFFLDQEFEKFYKEEIRTGRIAIVFSILAIFIASLGLFGLTLFIAEQRTKEIGIRKVLGAEQPSIIMMLSKEILILISISTLLAWAGAYLYFNNIWLPQFHFRIDLSIWPFIIAFFAALLIAFLTMSYRAIVAARTNPAAALKYE
jgi:putative ABC transport system permease protein